MRSDCFCMVRSSTSDVVGISRTTVPNKTLVTLQSHGVQVHDVVDRKLVKNWSVPSSESSHFPCPAVQAPLPRATGSADGSLIFAVKRQRQASSGARKKTKRTPRKKGAASADNEEANVDSLCCWASKIASLDDHTLKTHNLPGSVFRLLSSPNLAGQVVSVFTDGRVLVYNDKFNSSSEEAETESNDNSAVLWTHITSPLRSSSPSSSSSSAATTPSPRATSSSSSSTPTQPLRCFTISRTTSTDRGYTFDSHTITPPPPSAAPTTVASSFTSSPLSIASVSHDVRQHRLTPPSSSASLLSCSFQDSTNTLAVLWSDKSLQTYSLLPSASSSSPISLLHAMVVDGLDLADAEHTAHITAVGDSLFAVVGWYGKNNASTTSTGKRGRKSASAVESRLLMRVFDTRYGTLFGERAIEASAVDDEDDDGEDIVDDQPLVQVISSLDHSFIAIVTASAVHVVNYEFAVAPSLAANIGRLLPSSSSSSPVPSTLPPMSCPLDVLGLIDPAMSQGDDLVTANGASYAENDDEDKEENRVLTLLEDSSKTPNVTAFLRVFEPYVESKANSQRKSSSKRRTPDANLSHNFVVRVLGRCMAEEPPFWPAVRSLVRANTVSATYAPRLIGLILADQQLGLLDDVLRHVSDIGEKDLVRAVTYFVDPEAAEVDELKQFWREKAEEAGTSGGDEGVALCMQHFLALIICRPHNDIFILRYLRRMPVEQVRVLMRVLLHWLDMHEHNPLKKSTKKKEINVRRKRSGSGGGGNNSSRQSRDASTGLTIPPLTVVLDWMSLLLDSHVTEHILMEDVHQGDVLGHIQDSANRHLSSCESFVRLRGHLSHCLHHQKHVMQSQVPTYSVEVLQI
eukprot:TRINITY_DN5790_c0_g1_i1.p1 TRINITY_DN5790_c0_g1~~TRINITY_DN5790_c0_g1_i1.p1  ORF type:complete len:857 (-),score=274.29 TRINITY_DN5790_c0_g1_i1:101-2671(-)